MAKGESQKIEPVLAKKLTLSVAELAEGLGVSTEWVRDRCAEKKIPFIKLGPRLLRFIPEDIQEWLRKGNVNASP